MEQSQLINELVESAEPKVEKPSSPKRNSKHEIIEKILQLAEEINEPVLESNTALRRMTKAQLTDKLAGLVEKRIEFEASKILGLDKEQAKSPVVVNMAALRMVHSICVNSTEKFIDSTSGSHGYTVNGFSQRMRDSQENIDAILLEISEQYPDVIEKFSSPWVRLGLLWGSNVMLTIRKKKTFPNKKNYAPKIRSV